MEVVVLHGSPKRGGNSDTLAKEFLRGLKNHQIHHFYLNEMKIKPCQGCLHCATSPGHKCAIDDDMTQIYEEYKKAQLIVWVSPMYWGYITSQMKAAQDRMEALAWEGFDGKTFAVLLTYRYHYESTANMFKRIAPYFHIDLHIVPCRTYDPEAKRDMPITECTVGLKEAYELGVKLAGKR